MNCYYLLSLAHSLNLFMYANYQIVTLSWKAAFCACKCFLFIEEMLLVLQINDRYEFPLQLDLDRENGKYLSPEADRSVRNLYTLHRFQSFRPFGLWICCRFLEVCMMYLNDLSNHLA